MVQNWEWLAIEKSGPANLQTLDHRRLVLEERRLVLAIHQGECQAGRPQKLRNNRQLVSSPADPHVQAPEMKMMDHPCAKKLAISGLKG